MKKKIGYLFWMILSSSAVYSQDTTALQQIDALVRQINGSGFQTQTDTITNDLPKMGLSSRTYLTTVTDGSQLKKYVNNAHVTTQKNGTTKEMVGTNTFYFNQNKLIKVEENATKDGKQMDASWYYADDKPIYYTLKSDKSEERAELLLTIAKGIVEKMGFK